MRIKMEFHAKPKRLQSGALIRFINLILRLYPLIITKIIMLDLHHLMKT